MISIFHILHRSKNFEMKVLGWEKATVIVAVRGEYTDYNVGEFADNSDTIYDVVKAIVPATSLSPSLNTVLRIN